ncbi:unnamed protein product [Rhizoctonia solani]|uniref:Uncharacterized protein n=1 Tax=Rhizoctonia solani TaxID=456999 RepID=A0A8H3GJN0_9AGAM|nr:unnamed protein product [Rhizoctonia solani]
MLLLVANAGICGSAPRVQHFTSEWSPLNILPVYHVSSINYWMLSVRKKCDETKPKCTKRGQECEYEYIESSGTKKRTKPAPRPASELANNTSEQLSGSIIIPEPTNPTVLPDALDGLFDQPLAPSLDVAQPFNTDWESTLYGPATIPLLDPFAIRAIGSPSLVFEQPVASRNLTPIQANLFDALFSLGETDYSKQSVLSNSEITVAFSTPATDLNSYTQHPSGAGSCHLIGSASNPHIDNYEEDEEDLEGVGEILCRTPVILDPMVDSNSLTFVLHSYAQWMRLAIFDPFSIAPTVQEDIISRFLGCPRSRSRLLLVSKVIRKLVKSWDLDEGGKTVLSSLRDQIWQNIIGYRAQGLLSDEEERKRAAAALDQTTELLSLHVVSSPLVYTLRLLRSAAPVFVSACPPPHLPDMVELLLEADINLRHFAVMDVGTSITTGRSHLCRYHIPWSLEICDKFVQKREDQGLRWLAGVPDQFILLFGYMNNLREAAIATRTQVDSRIIEQIEEDMKVIVIPQCESKDPSVAIARMVVQECWREVVFIFLYMAVCGADALDPRVEKAQRGFMRLVKGVKPGRNPDAFLVVPMIIAGVATMKSSHRQIIISRILSRPEFTNPNTAVNDYLRMLEDIWARTQAEARVARWEDLREACRRVTGV